MNADWQELQAKVSAAAVTGGEVLLEARTYRLDLNIVPAPGYPGPLTDARRPITIRGQGMHATTLQMADATFAYTGILGYGWAGHNPVLAQCTVSDLTIDGNYSGIDAGEFPQQSAGALVSLTPPYTNAADGKPNGLYHQFRRVRFYRPTCFAFQGTQGIQLTDCIFEACGQPDLPLDATHVDILGSGIGDAIVDGCHFLDSSGNYADFTTGPPGSWSRLIFTRNVSRNHQIGGVYACGTGSIIALNHLDNRYLGSGIGYDSTAPEANRFKNLIALNVVPNLTVGGLLRKYGDLVFANIAADVEATQPVFGPMGMVG